MDANTIHSVLSEIYIPPSKSHCEKCIPQHHPSLVLQDRSADSTHRMNCGCCVGTCIAENAWWDHPANKSSSSLNLNLTSGYNNTNNNSTSSNVCVSMDTDKFQNDYLPGRNLNSHNTHNNNNNNNSNNKNVSINKNNISNQDSNASEFISNSITGSTACSGATDSHYPVYSHSNLSQESFE